MVTLGMTPEVFDWIRIALLPKDVGDRPIATFTTCIRMLTRWMKRNWGAKWADYRADPQTYGRAGSTCIHCVWKHSLIVAFANRGDLLPTR